MKLKRTEKKALFKQRRFNTHKLKKAEEREKFGLELRNIFAVLEEQQEEKGVKEIWNNIKNVLNETAEKVIGKREQKEKETEETKSAIKDRREIKQKKMNSIKSMRITEKCKRQYCEKDKKIKKMRRRDKRENINKLKWLNKKQTKENKAHYTRQ